MSDPSGLPIEVVLTLAGFTLFFLVFFIICNHDSDEGPR